MGGARFFGWLAVAAAALPARGAWAARPAEGRGLFLSWSAPEGCPGDASVRAEIARLVGRSARGARARLVAVAEVEHDGAGTWTLRLELSGRDRAPTERRIEAGSCEELADATAVIVALAAGEKSPAAGKPKAPTAPASTRAHVPPAVRSSPSALEGRTPRTAEQAGNDWSARATAGVDVASLPATAPGFGASLALQRGGNRFELLGTGWLPQRALAPGEPAKGAEVSLLTAGVRYCRVLGHAAGELAACAGLEAGGIRAASFGVAEPGAGTSAWLAPGLGIVGRLPLGAHLGLAVEVSALVPVLRDRFVLEGVGTVFRPPPVAGRGFVGGDVSW